MRSSVSLSEATGVLSLPSASCERTSEVSEEDLRERVGDRFETVRNGWSEWKDGSFKRGNSFCAHTFIVGLGRSFLTTGVSSSARSRKWLLLSEEESILLRLRFGGFAVGRGRGRFGLLSGEGEHEGWDD